MLRHKCLLLAVKITYLYTLIMGLSPGIFNRQKFKFETPRCYRIYSAMAHCLLLLAIPLTFPQYLREQSYMVGRPILYVTYLATSFVKATALVTLISQAWLKRDALLGSFNAYAAILKRFEHFQVGAAIQQVTRQIELLLLGKFIFAAANLLLTSGFFLKIDRKHGDMYLIMVFMNFVLSSFVYVAVAQFFYALALLHCQFDFINVALCDMRRQLRGLAHKRKMNIPENFSTTVNRLSLRLGSLSAMHGDCFRLAQRVFRLFQLPTVIITLRTFATNIRIVYQAVLILTFTMGQGDVFVHYNGLLVMITFYLDTMLLVRIVDGLLAACNGTGQQLRYFSELLELRDCNNLTETLEAFSSQLHCHKLKFKVCGLFEVDKAAGLKYFLTVFVQVTVLMQTD